MLVVRIELWPHGDERRKKLLSEAHIWNDLTGTPFLGNYVAEVKHADHEDARFPTVRIIGFPRLTLGPWVLLWRVLHEALMNRDVDGEG